jgi:hypothetical protein
LFRCPTKESSIGGLSNQKTLHRNSSPPYEVSIVDSSISKVPHLDSISSKRLAIERHLNSYVFSNYSGNFGALPAGHMSHDMPGCRTMQKYIAVRFLSKKVEL